MVLGTDPGRLLVVVAVMDWALVKVGMADTVDADVIDTAEVSQR